ncbi:unnamed protein product [Orchesella dallaii]|uniref:F-box domain-containing protein n=1 Tax=Orchesella dallaii TaxID=48710 RepID=A0ABP1S1H4_9HEXA
MNHQPPRPLSKIVKVGDVGEKDASQQNPPVPQPQPYEYLSGALLDCWPTIFGFVTDSQTLVALRNTCQLFNDMVAPRMAELLIPILMQNVRLQKHDILSIRGTGKRVKSKIDTMLFNRDPDYRIKPRFILAETEAITKFRRVAPFMLTGSFAENYLEIRTNSEESLEGRIAIFSSSYDPQQVINKIKIGVKMEVPPVFFGQLNRFLSLLPEVQTLALRFVDWERRGDLVNNGYKQWINLQMEPEFLPHQLPHLTDLTLINGNNVISTSRVFELLIQRYGKQLHRFACDGDVFLRIGNETCNEFLSNIRLFSLVYQYHWKELYRKLTSLQWLRLESLTLSGNRYLSLDFFRAIASFSASLCKLDLLKMNSFEVTTEAFSTTDLQPAREMKCLIICINPGHFDNDLHINRVWTIFRKVFVNLESLTVVCGDAKQLFDELADPCGSWRRRYFIIFPKLKKLVIRERYRRAGEYLKEWVFCRPSTV